MIIALYWMTWALSMYVNCIDRWPWWALLLLVCAFTSAMVYALVAWHDMKKRVEELEEKNGRLLSAITRQESQIRDIYKKLTKLFPGELLMKPIGAFDGWEIRANKFVKVEDEKH